LDCSSKSIAPDGAWGVPAGPSTNIMVAWRSGYL
jgi:hypothetical protein